MELILMRHAIAEPRSERWPDDGLRPLTRDGERKHRSVSEAMRRMGISFGELITSPLVRARQTAEITARVYGWDAEIREADVLGSDFSIPALMRFLKQYEGGSSILCVGHEPDLSTFAAQLLHPSGEVEIAFKKSAVLGLELAKVRAGAGVLLYFLKPGHLARLGKRG